MISIMGVRGRGKEIESHETGTGTGTENVSLSAIVNEMYETETETEIVKKIETARQITVTPSASKSNAIGTEITE